MLREDLPLLIKEAKSLGFEKINVLTNGLLLSEEKAIELLESGLERISISLDGWGKAHEIQRGIKGSFSKMIKALEILTKLRDTKYHYLDVTVSTTLTRISIPNVPKIIELCDKLNVTWIPNTFETVSFQFKGINKDPLTPLTVDDRRLVHEVFEQLHDLVGRKPLSPLITHIGLEYAKSYLLGNIKPKIKDEVPCTAGFQSIYIDAYGNVYPGCWALPPVGNLRRSNLQKIVFSPEYRKRLKVMFKKNCPYCTNSLLVNTWYYLPSILKELQIRMFDKRGGFPFSWAKLQRRK